MSHSEALSRLAVGERIIEMIKWLLRKGIDKLEREWNDAVYTCDMIGASRRAAWWFSRVTGLASAALVVGFGLATAAAARASVQPAAVPVYTMSAGRIGAILAAVVGLIGAIIGGRALARSTGGIGVGDARRRAIMALVLGPVGLVIGGLVVATAGGGIGTGNGLAGGIVAMVVGLISTLTGGLALARSRRTG